MLILEPGGEPIPGYFLAKKLGEGSFGVVWSADGPGQTRVALKFLDLHQAGGAKEFEAISAIKNIRHPNLLPITGYWRLDGGGKPIGDGRGIRFRTASAAQPATLVIAMVAGEKSLDDVLCDHQSKGCAGIPISELLDYVEDAARGLDFLNATRHDLGDGRLVSIQHRDIKPDNILLVGDAAVLCDFGVARASNAESIRATGMIGSPAFISPESILGNVASGSSDQYSLALTYYYLRSGQHAVQVMNQATAINCHVRGELDFSRAVADEQAVLRRATHLQATARFESCRDMVRALRRAIESTTSVSSIEVPYGHGVSALVNADATATAVDQRFQSTPTAASSGPAVDVLRQCARIDHAIVNRSVDDGRTGTWRRAPGRSVRVLRRVAVSSSMIVLAGISLQFVSHGPTAQAAQKFKSKQAANGDAVSLQAVTPIVHAHAAVMVAAQSQLETPVAIETPEPESPSDQFMPDDMNQTLVVQSTTTESVDENEATIEATKAVEIAAEIEVPSTVRIPIPSVEPMGLETFIKLGGRFDAQLVELDLSNTKITIAELEQLAALPQLESLSLENTSIDNECIALIVKSQPNLKSLFLSGTKVTGAGLEPLSALRDLMRLDLSCCDIDDVGLIHLRKLENLTAIGLGSTRVSRGGMHGLSEALSHRAVIQGPEFNLLGGKRMDVIH